MHLALGAETTLLNSRLVPDDNIYLIIIGHTHIHSEHLKGWLWEAYPDRYTTSPNPSHWEKLGTLMHHMWEHITLPTDLIWNILVLLPI